MSRLTHLDESGAAHMVDIGGKPATDRIAVATGHVTMTPATLEALREGSLTKGDALAVARVAGIQAAKRCSDLIPLCHPLMLNKVEVAFSFEKDGLAIRATCGVSGATGVEMEALTAVSVAALTIYDMGKALDREMVIGNIRLESKEGGKSGNWRRDTD